MDALLCKKTVERSLTAGCEESDSSLRIGFSIQAGIEMGKEFFYHANRSILGVRVLCDGKIGIAHFFISEIPSIDNIVDIAINSAKANPDGHRKNKICYTDVLPKEQMPEVLTPPSQEKTLKWLKEVAASVQNRFNCKLLLVKLNYELSDNYFYNSSNADGQYRYLFSCVTGLALTNNLNQAGIIPFVCEGISTGESIIPHLESHNFAERIALRSAATSQEIKGVVRFSSYSAIQLISSIITAFNGISILCRTSFFKLQDIDKKIWDTSVSLVDDPVANGSKAKIPFDDEGIPARKKYLVRDGVFNDILSYTPLHSASNIGTPGNARRILPDCDLQVGPSNIILEVSGDYPDINIDQYIMDMGMGCEFNLYTGKIKCQASGYSFLPSGKTPAKINIDVHLNKLLSRVYPASKPEWYGSACAPAFISIID